MYIQAWGSAGKIPNAVILIPRTDITSHLIIGNYFL